MSQNLEERRLYEKGRNDRAATNHRYTKQISRLNVSLSQNLASQKRYTAKLEAEGHELWQKQRDLKVPTISKEQYNVLLEDYLDIASIWIVEKHELEKKHRQLTRDLMAVKRLMAAIREVDTRIEATRKVEYLGEDALPEDACLAFVKRPIPAGLPESVVTSTLVKATRRLQSARPTRPLRPGQPGQRSRLSKCTQPADLTQSDQSDQLDESARIAQSAQPVQCLRLAQPSQPTHSARPAQFQLAQPSDSNPSSQLVRAQPAEVARLAQPVEPGMVYKVTEHSIPQTQQETTELSSAGASSVRWQNLAKYFGGRKDPWSSFFRTVPD